MIFNGPLQGVDISARDIAHPYGARINCSGNNAPVINGQVIATPTHKDVALLLVELIMPALLTIG